MQRSRKTRPVKDEALAEVNDGEKADELAASALTKNAVRSDVKTRAKKPGGFSDADNPGRSSNIQVIKIPEYVLALRFSFSFCIMTTFSPGS